jgi:hypothetical protein
MYRSVSGFRDSDDDWGAGGCHRSPTRQGRSAKLPATVATATADLGGSLDVVVFGGQSDLTTRGDVQEFTVLTAADVNGTFDALSCDGNSLTPICGDR